MGNSILWQLGEQSIIDTWLLGGTSNVPTAGSGNWGVGLGAQSGGVGTDKTKNNGTTTSTIGEIGQTTAANYGRVSVLRSSSGWSAPSSPVSGDYQSTSNQATFNFNAAPNLNGATLWFVAKSTGIGNVDCFFGADLAATRTFANGDQEKITATYRQTS